MYVPDDVFSDQQARDTSHYRGIFFKPKWLDVMEAALSTDRNAPWDSSIWLESSFELWKTTAMQRRLHFDRINSSILCSYSVSFQRFDYYEYHTI